MTEHRGTAPASVARLVKAATLAAILLLSTACSELLEVDLPGRLDAEALDDPNMIAVLQLGMLADFECAFQGYALTSAVLSAEFQDAITARAPLIWVNRLETIEDVAGTIDCTTYGGAYLPLHTARFQAEELYRRAESFPDNVLPGRAEILATAAAYAGYGTLLLGEGFCEMTMDGGSLLTRAEVFQRAETWFTAALGHSPSEQIRGMALVGRARTRLNLGNGPGAVEDASQVPDQFTRTIQMSRSTPRRENRMFVVTHQDREMSVAPSYRDLQVEGVPDVRVHSVLSPNLGQDNVTPLWLQQKFDDILSPAVVAGWREAQLIIAEVQGGQEAVAAINRLRAAAGVPAFASDDPAQIRSQVLEERRRELYLEGHRLGDMIRLEIPFPSGTTHKGEPYGPITCIPLPRTERNVNPNL